MIYHFAATILSSAASMSQCTRRRSAIQIWSPEKLPTFAGCCALRRTISKPTASLKRRVTWRATTVWCTSIRTRAIESGVCASATAKFPSRCKVVASNSLLMLRKAALESLAIGILPFYYVKEDLSSIGFANVPSRSRLGLGAFRSSHWPSGIAATRILGYAMQRCNEREVTMAPIINIGANCWEVASAAQTGLLIDGRNYYRAFYQAARAAKRYILISGWQFDSDVMLLRGEDTA